GQADTGYAINLDKDGKTFFLYDNYVVQVSPVYFEVYTNYADTEIKMDGNVVVTSDADEYTEEIGPFLPGEYTFTASYKSNFVDLSKEVEAEQFNSDEPESVELFIEGEQVEINAPYDGVLD